MEYKELNGDIRKEFPILNNSGAVYLDSAATTQKPSSVLESVGRYYLEDNANPLRGIYDLSVKATDDYEDARQAVADFINAKSASEIIFTRNATESLNLAAFSYGQSVLTPCDEIIVSTAEHHSNLLPWQAVAGITGAKVSFFDPEPDGSFDLNKLESMISDRTKIVAITHVSNVTGRINDIKTIAALAHKRGAVCVVDAAQSVAHLKTDVRDTDVDFLAFSGHKMYAPMGIGVLYVKENIAKDMPPFLYGGEMIDKVTKLSALYAPAPRKFEAGTVNVGGAVGLKSAIEFINAYGFEQIISLENSLSALAVDGIKKIPGAQIIGGDKACNHHGIVAFRIEGVHPHDVAQIFADENVCVRAGHHCAEPLHKYFADISGEKVTSSTRMSVGIYNTKEDVEKFLGVLSEIRERMGY